MASGSPSWRIILKLLLLVLLCSEAIDARKIKTDGEGEENDHVLISSHQDHTNDPSVNIFFTIDKLKIGAKLSLYFSQKDPSTVPPLLSRTEAESIPFSASNLSNLLDYFSIPKISPQAGAMAYTLGECELEVEKEVKFCATSLESMLDSAIQTLGSDTKVLATEFITEPGKELQNYTVLGEPKEVPSRKMIGCHKMPYPYAVYYCHSQEGGNRVFEVSLGGRGDGGGDGERVRAVVVCHVDTSMWDPNHVAFSVLGMEPGSGPVCHICPGDDLVWVKI